MPCAVYSVCNINHVMWDTFSIMCIVKVYNFVCVHNAQSNGFVWCDVVICDSAVCVRPHFPPPLQSLLPEAVDCACECGRAQSAKSPGVKKYKYLCVDTTTLCTKTKSETILSVSGSQTRRESHNLLSPVRTRQLGSYCSRPFDHELCSINI